MLRKKILFWVVWLVFLPFLWLYFSVKTLLKDASRRNWFNPTPYWWKIGLIRQAVYEKMVLEKKEVIEDFRKNPRHPDSKWEKERREIQKFAKDYRKNRK